jgi:signal transduction histidine kinase
MSVGSHRRGREPDGPDTRRRSALPHVRDWRVGTKLAAALVVPSVAFLVLAALQTGTVVSRASALDEFAGQIGLARQATALVHELQRERDRTVGELAGIPATTPPGQATAQLTAVLQPIHGSVDASLTAYRAAARGHADGSAAWRSALSAADQRLDQVRAVRAGVLGGSLRGRSVSDGYTRAVDALLDLLAQPAPGDDQGELAQPVLAYVELARAKEVNSLLRGRLFALANAGRFAGSDKVELSDLRAQQLAALAGFRVAATGEQVDLYQRTLSVPDVQEAGKLEETATAAAAGDRVDLDPARWWTLSSAEHDLVRQVETRLVDSAVRRVDSASSAQWWRTVLVAGLVLLVLLAAMAASVAIGRSMARSLRQLRGQALTVAQTQLPQLLERLRQADGDRPAVPEATGHGDPLAEIEAPLTRSADEIGDVAEAFRAVHRSAVHLALEQAAMRRNRNAIFVSLARRSQVLVERQLELLDRLERAERDPDQLANLFQLDHLAARMRRNDDNLLVLTGGESRRRWTEPVALSTVVLAAVAEIEQYPRVRQEVDDRLHLVGPAVGDLAHLLAELLENATTFSPPDGPVLVTGAPAADGRAAVIEITDTGIGMSPRALAEANDILASPPQVDAAAAERMGLVVVSHLAARQGVRVQLALVSPGSRAGGLVATVRLPAELLTPAAGPQERVAPATSGMPVTLAPANGSGRHAVDLAARVGSSLDPVPWLPPAGSGPRGVPTRAEDVLGAGEPAPSAGTAWWSRTPSAAESPRLAGRRLPEGPPEVPITGGTSESGLPLRVPMAQLPRATVTGDRSPGGTGDWPGRSRPPTPPPPELDPEAVGGALSRFYSGVRQAQAEDVVVPVYRPGGVRWSAPVIPGGAVDEQYEEGRR